LVLSSKFTCAYRKNPGLVNDAQDVAFFHDEQFFAIKLDFGPGIFGEQHAIADSRMELAVDVLTKEGAVVAWMLQPPLERTEVGVKSDDFSPERVARYDELVRELVRRRPTQVVAVDFAGWMMSQAPAVRARLRPDGVHMKKETAPGAADWIGPAVLAAYARLRPSGGD
jgi:hypothetical protein